MSAATYRRSRRSVCDAVAAFAYERQVFALAELEGLVVEGAPLSANEASAAVSYLRYCYDLVELIGPAMYRTKNVAAYLNHTPTGEMPKLREQHSHADRRPHCTTCGLTIPLALDACEFCGEDR